MYFNRRAFLHTLRKIIKLSFVQASLFEAVGGAMSLALCLQVVSQAQHFRSSVRAAGTKTVKGRLQFFCQNDNR